MKRKVSLKKEAFDNGRIFMKKNIPVKLFHGAEVYVPEYLGKKDVLVIGDRIVDIADYIEVGNEAWVEKYDATGKWLIPGLVDSHVHILGGGGEGGFATRTPELRFSDLIEGGITSLVGCRGTDGFGRSMPELAAKAKFIQEHGISCYILTGSYQIPVKTLTGSIESDIMFVDQCIGVGEIAISDHRSSQPTLQEVARVASSARVAGMLSGKKGIVNIHMGDAPSMLNYLDMIIEQNQIPASQFIPTHMGRNPILFEKGMEYAQKGGFVDFTTSTVPYFEAKGEIPAPKALKRYLEAGVPLEQMTFSSDGQGSLPCFDSQGRLESMMIGRVFSLFEAVKEAYQIQGIPFEKALQVITKNPARVFGLKNKGEIAINKDADLLILDPSNWSFESVLAKGQYLKKKDEIKKANFE